LDFTHPNSKTPKTNQKVLKLEKETSQSSNLSWISLIPVPTPKNKSRSPQIRKRNITIFKSWISLIPTPKQKQQIKKSS
jgi:hypothetical protein